MTPYQHACLVFDAAIAAHSTACVISRAGRRAGASAEVRAANRARRRDAHAAVNRAFKALNAAYAATYR